MFEIDEYIRRFSRYPSPLPLKHWKREHEEISVHTRALTPKKIIDGRRPFEDEGIKNYRKDTYEPITASIFSRAIDNLQRILSGAQVSINVDDELRNYLSQPAYGGVDFRTFINKRVVRRMIEDPNGVLLWWPSGRGVDVANVQVDVEPLLVLSTQIKHYDENVFTFLSRESSPVTTTEEGRTVTKNEGKVFYVVTKESYYRYVQIGAKQDNKFELIEVYRHDLNRLPLITLGGEEAEELKQDGSSIIYQKSYFHSAVPYANETIRQFSDHQGIMVTAAFPIREMEEIPCTAEGCKGGVIQEVEEKNGERHVNTKTCSTCGGRGYIVPLSPYGVLTKKTKSGLLEKDQKADVPMMRYISPDVEIVKYSGEHWRQLLKDAEKALNLLFIDEAQSGKAKEIDREDKVSMLDKIGSNVFNSIVLQSLRIIDSLRNIGGGKGKTISVTLPATFQAKTESELIEEIVTLRDKNAPSFLLAQATIDYVKKRYSGDRVMMKAIDFLSGYDPIFYLTQEEKDRLLANSVVTEDQHGRSLYAFSVVQTVAREKGEEFLTLTQEEITKAVDALLLPMVNKASLPSDGI